jgi:hypothetical protein
MKPPGAHDYAQGGGAVLVVVLDGHIAGLAGVEFRNQVIDKVGERRSFFR